MINGLLYGVIYFSLIPLITMLASGFDLSFYPEKFFLTKEYSITLSTTYISLTIVAATLLLLYLSRNTIRPVAENTIFKIREMRAKSATVFIISTATLASQAIDVIYIDHTTHWLDRETLSIIPESIKFYINPFNTFAFFLAALNISCSAVIFFQREKHTAIITPWLLADASLIAITIYNSGNRWYLALLMAIYFYFSTSSSKKKIICVAPALILTGGMLSISILAIRVGADVNTLIMATFNPQNILSSFLVATMNITEGLNLPSLFELGEISLLSPDPIYPILKILQMPIPGSMIEKLPPFNIYVTYLLVGYYSEWSLNTSLLGIFIYGFGIAALPMLIIFFTLTKKIELSICNKKQSIAPAIWFCLLFSGYRFGFEYLFVHTLYFTIILILVSKKLTPASA